MFGCTQRAKLLELRQKTDQELIRLVTNRLKSATTQAQRFAEASSDALYTGAEKSYKDAAVLVGVISSASEAERARLEKELGELRRLLDQRGRQQAA